MITVGCTLLSTVSFSKLNTLWGFVSYITYQEKRNSLKQDIRVSFCFVLAFSCAKGMQITSACYGFWIASRDVFYISIFHVSLVLSLSQVWSDTAIATNPWGDILVSHVRHLMAIHTDHLGFSFCFSKPHTTPVTFSSVTSFACYKFSKGESVLGHHQRSWGSEEGADQEGPECAAGWSPLRNL